MSLDASPADSKIVGAFIGKVGPSKQLEIYEEIAERGRSNARPIRQSSAGSG
jgi:hypothetical protein